MSKQEKIVCAAVKVCITNDNYSEPVVVAGIDYQAINNSGLLSAVEHPTYCNMNHLGFITNKNRFVDPVEAMRIAVKAEQVGGILWKKVEARMLNDCGFIDRSKVKRKAIDETIKNYLELPLRPEDLY